MNHVNELLHPRYTTSSLLPCELGKCCKR